MVVKHPRLPDKRYAEAQGTMLTNVVALDKSLY